jgi:hypothetical protein
MTKKAVEWEVLKSKGFYTKRAKVPGGWFVMVEQMLGTGAFFYPDPDHSWDGTSLE